MSVTTVSSPVSRSAEHIQPEGLWLRNRNWDTLYMTLSVFLVPMPYLFYLIGKDILQIDKDVARNAVNLAVALLVGGPHMYATFMRTALDEKFVKRYPALIRSSIIIPVVVVSLAFLNLSLLLTVFFFWASIHVLHQVTYIVELYNKRTDGKSAVTLWARVVDYALILTCLFPIAALKISQHNFHIGTNDLTAVIPDFFFTSERRLLFPITSVPDFFFIKEGTVPWFFILMTTLFGAAVIAFIVKSYREWKGGYLHWPKTVFIVITVAVACTMPALENLDTAFQGLNTWHSFQYLALTIYILKLRQQSGDLKVTAPMIDRVASQPLTIPFLGITITGASAKLYGFSLFMLVGSLFLGTVVYIVVGLVDPTRTASARFDTAYYTAILCFLWIHYYHDHFLFTDFEAVERAAAA